MRRIGRFNIVQIIIGAVVLILFFVFLFRKKIAEHKVTKAKMEVFKRMSKTAPKEWDNEIKEVYDSMIVEKADTLKRE